MKKPGALHPFDSLADTYPIGTITFEYRGIPVYENGIEKDQSYGKHFSHDGNYYYGQKWQCVEFIKRYYDRALNHRMPHVWGHAKDFFDATLEPGQLNRKRNLIQFENGGRTPPEINDILVFSDTRYGHLAIVSAVDSDTVEVVQQNITGKPRQTYRLKRTAGFYIDKPRVPDGWLRLPNSIRYQKRF